MIQTQHFDYHFQHPFFVYHSKCLILEPICSRWQKQYFSAIIMLLLFTVANFAEIVASRCRKFKILTLPFFQQVFLIVGLNQYQGDKNKGHHHFQHVFLLTMLIIVKNWNEPQSANQIPDTQCIIYKRNRWSTNEEYYRVRLKKMILT